MVPCRSRMISELVQHDVRHLGREHVICCFELGDVIVDPGPESSVRTLLAALDGRVPRAILLTHVHLDHAGATGSLVRLPPSPAATTNRQFRLHHT